MSTVEQRIFLSYRRDDTGDASGRIYDRLCAAFGADAVFKDVDKLNPGVEFGAHILQVLQGCQIFLALIGPRWADVQDDCGNRRLDDADDWVRLELEAALKASGVQVVPVLVNEARLPEIGTLPDSIRRIRALNVAYVRRDPDFHRDMDRLIQALRGSGRTGPMPSRPGALGVPADHALPEMVSIPLGTFTMGSTYEEKGSSDSERPQHCVHIRHAFELGKYPVTFAEWDWARSAGAKLPRLNRGWARDRHPVVNISWNDAQAYIAFLNAACGLIGRDDAYRFPSEAEWEYACRAGTTTSYWTGETIGPSQACLSSKLAVVGSYPANSFGVFDMTGNVWEWCEDVWHNNYVGAPSDGSPWVAGGGAVERRVRRGGCWSGYLPQDLRSASRSGIDPEQRSFDTGLRLARTAGSDLVSFP
ncbi:MAG: SUMF1/EgtB/PvdO family nonheme iron enzyme [Hyphomonadaceae bacterium]|nr:SUMF1/EgtB/PvdO family nonheme iron enzyme [Hyphomonadaceae bacterium]